MPGFTVTCEFLEHKHVRHLRFLNRKAYDNLQRELKSRWARIDPDPPFVESAHYDLSNANLICGNENMNPGDLLAVCLRAL
jgi:hypothetical protein